MKPSLVTCLKCGEVHFAVSREYAVKQVHQFNIFFQGLSEEEKESYGNKEASIKEYEHCTVCGGIYKNFRPYQKGDCPDGVTLSPIIENNS